MANQIYIFDQFGDIERLSENDLPLKIKVARGSSYALWSLSKSRKNKIYIQKSGGLSLLVHLVRTRNISVIIPAIGTLQVLLQQEFFLVICKHHCAFFYYQYFFCCLLGMRK